jgi:hypothetical protein
MTLKPGKLSCGVRLYPPSRQGFLSRAFNTFALQIDRFIVAKLGHPCHQHHELHHPRATPMGFSIHDFTPPLGLAFRWKSPKDTKISKGTKSRKDSKGTKSSKANSLQSHRLVLQA